MRIQPSITGAYFFKLFRNVEKTHQTHKKITRPQHMLKNTLLLYLWVNLIPSQIKLTQLRLGIHPLFNKTILDTKVYIRNDTFILCNDFSFFNLFCNSNYILKKAEIQHFLKLFGLNVSQTLKKISPPDKMEILSVWITCHPNGAEPRGEKC